MRDPRRVLRLRTHPLDSTELPHVFKILGRITWHVLKIVAPPLARKLKHKLVGGHEQRPSKLDRVKRLGRR